MSTIIKGKVQNLYETASVLTTKNRTLRSGTIGIESDTGKIKVGDGVTSWNSLPYTVGGGADWSSDETYNQGDVSTHAKDQWISKEDNNTEEPGTGTKWTQDSRLTWLIFRKYYTTSFVNHSGKWWTALQDSEGVEPGTDTDTWIEVAFNSGSGKEIGELFFSAVPVEQSGCKWADYLRLSQSIYAPLFAKIGHLYAKTSADAISAEAAGLFHIPDAMFLFPRGGKVWNITDAQIDISNDYINIGGHGFTSSDNGRPIKLQRVPGETTTLPTGITEYDQYYLRYIDADYIEIYATEAEAIDTSETTGRVDFTTAGSGTFLLATMGCYQDSALEEHGHNITGQNTNGGGGTLGLLSTAKAGDTDFDYVAVTEVKDANVSNETRSAYASFGMQIKVVSTSVSTGEPYDTLAYDTGLVTPTTWANATETITHNLDADLKDLLIECWLQADGFSSRDLLTAGYDYGSHGACLIAGDDNSFSLRFAANGAMVLNDTGTFVTVASLTNPQYQIKVYKPNFINATVPIGNVTYKYDTGWFTPPTGWISSKTNIAHNFDCGIEDLIIVGLARTTAQPEPQPCILSTEYGGSQWGSTSEYVDNDTISFNCNGQGPVIGSSTASGYTPLQTAPGAEVKIIIYKPELITENVVSPQEDTMSSSMSYEITANTVDYLIDSSSVSSGQTLTLSRGTGANVKNRVILNNESANSVTVTDGTTIFTAIADSINTYYFNNTELKEGSW